ncbi:MAG: hypothetical protein ABIY55_31745 [Kofleriaceae bacterium]
MSALKIHSPFSINHTGATYEYQHDFVRVSDHAWEDSHAIHRWTASLLPREQLGPGAVDAAQVGCGDDGTCAECSNGPPCSGGGVRPLTSGPKHILLHPKADLDSDASEISLAEYPHLQIAILDASPTVSAALVEWRKKYVCSSAAVYHVYRIETAPSKTKMVGKLIAIPVTPPPTK